MNSNRKTVAGIMNRDIIMTRADAQLAPVVEMMMRRGMGEIPVVDHDHALLGVVTRVDLLNPPAKAHTGSAEEYLGQQQTRSGVTCDLDQGFHLDVESSVTVGDVMSQAVVAVKPDTTTREAAKLMAKNRMSVLPVVSHLGVLIGTVSAIDLVSFLN